MITHELIERIEGEAALDFQTDDKGAVEEVNIRFFHFRGMEAIMEGRSALDALVITPRVCGICGHSHLIAAVRMLESLYRSAGHEAALSPKAESIRRITLQCEVLQSHFKWLYLTMLPESAKLIGGESISALKALYAASQANAVAALFSGQWPHSAYAQPGGVTCDPTHVDVIRARSILSEIIRFMEDEVLGCGVERFESVRRIDELLALAGDAGELLRNVEKAGLLEEGKSYGRFLILGEGTMIDESGEHAALAECVSEALPYTPHGASHAKNALYDGRFFESGPLARSLARQDGVVAALVRTFGDSAASRIAARIAEMVVIVQEIRALLEALDLAEPSFIPPTPIELLSGEGTGIVEAPRGSLIHKAAFEKGKILSYSIITPTQWNLGNGTPESPGVAQKAMMGSQSREKAAFLFRTFDVCSVCTTH